MRPFIYGPQGKPVLGERLEDEDYDVFIVEKNDTTSSIDDLVSDHWNNIDMCVMWATYTVLQIGPKENEEVHIQNSDTDIVKCYKSVDEILEDLWRTLEDIPMDPETEKMEDGWFIFSEGTDRSSIWNWFDHYHSKGVGWILENVEE